MAEKMYKVISKESRSGISRIGKPYCFEYLIVNFSGKPARIQLPKDKDMEVNVNDCVTLGFGTRKGFGCAEICPVITEVIPAQNGE